MGFDVSSTGSILTFPEGSRYHGLEVQIDEAPFGLLTTVMENYSKLTEGNLDVKAAAEVYGVIAESFASVLEEWNAERKGVPVPPTLEGLKSLGLKFVVGLIGAWVTGKTDVDDNLGKGSTSGESSPEELAAMAALSQSLPSSGEQNF